MVSNEEKGSEAWLLLSILCADRGNGASLEEILYHGDYINHAIFTESELIDGLKKLHRLDLIEKKGNLIFKTSKTEEILASKKFCNVDLFKKWDAINAYLVKQNLNRIVIQKDDNSEIETFIRENLKPAFESYIKKTGGSSNF